MSYELFDDSPTEHGPKAGCNYKQCGLLGDAHNCPFTKDGRLPTIDDIDIEALGERESQHKAELLDELADVLRRILEL